MNSPTSHRRRLARTNRELHEVGSRWSAELLAVMVSKAVSLEHETIPVAVEFIPYISIQLACVAQSRNAPSLELRIERSKVPEFSSESGWGSAQEARELLHLGIGGLRLLKGNSAI